MNLIDMMEGARVAPVASVNPSPALTARDCEPTASIAYLAGDGPTRADYAATIRSERATLRRIESGAIVSSFPIADVRRRTLARIQTLLAQGRAIAKPARVPVPAYVGPYAPGTPAIGIAGQLGYVLHCESSDQRTFTIGAQGLQRDDWRVVIVWPNRIDSYSENIAAPYIARAAHRARCDDLAIWHHNALARAESDKRELDRASQEASQARAAWSATVAEKWPAWAESALVAVHHENKSDSMTDYYGHSQTRAVVLAFSRHKRDIFSEMRKAARLFPETAHLSDAGPEVENREKYSMGAGYYLKKGWIHHTGWHVEKMTRGFVEGLRGAEFLDLPDVPAHSQKTGDGQAVGAMRIERQTHTKRGFDMWLCVMADRVERERFELLRDAAKDAGGWYSRPWGKTPGGFAFKVEADALAFASQHGGADTEGAGQVQSGQDQPRTARAASPVDGQRISEKLRDMADSLDSAIADKFRDRRANTPKQQKQAAQARQDGLDLERAQKAMRALADAHEAGTVPPELANVRTKAMIIDYCRERLDFSRGGYYSPGQPQGVPSVSAPEAAALWAFIATPVDPAAREAEELRQKIDGLKFANIPGFFPTPAVIIDSMADYADIREGLRVLEPSAGSGNIAEGMKERGCSVRCIERNWTLADILTRKGFDVTREDFLTVCPADLGTFDAVMMNPPFENGQDVQHVKHAWEFVKPGGALVAIMSAGVTFRRDREAFRAWVDDLGGEIVPLPEGAFK